MKKQVTASILAAAMLLSTSAFAMDTVSPEEDGIMYAFQDMENDIKYAVSAGIAKDENYDINSSITRAQFCEFAYNMLSSIIDLPVAKLERSPFDDFSTPEINTLAFIGIINGKSDRTFAPKDTLTREEAAVILYRIASYAKVDMPVVKVDMSYSDNQDISEWAVSPIYSLKILNLINTPESSFKPQGNYTIGESLFSLARLHKLIKK